MTALSSGGRFFSRISDVELVTCAATMAPANPFVTAGYLAAQAALGFTCWGMGIEEKDGPTTITFGFLKRGRLNASLEITSMPPVDTGSPFWRGLHEFCRIHRVTRLTVNSFASPCADIPPLGRETDRYSRTEFVIDLMTPDLLANVSRSHRERIKKARKLGIELRRSTAIEDLPQLSALHNASMLRRLGKGEQVALQDEPQHLSALLAAGCGELFQAVRGTEVLGAIFVLRASAGAYSCSSGNSAEGMKCGASHFLTYETARALQEEGLSVFNRSGARPHETGLREFKQRFGAREVTLESAAFDLGGPVRRAMTHLAALASRST